MINREFIQKLSGAVKKPRNETSACVSQLTDIIFKTLEKEDVEIPGFGRFVFLPGKRPKFKPDEKLIQEINIK